MGKTQTRKYPRTKFFPPKILPLQKSLEERVKSMTESMSALHVQASAALDTLNQRTSVYINKEQEVLLTKYKKQ